MKKQKIYCGFAVADITPPKPALTAGYPDGRFGRYTHDPLYATAMAFGPDPKNPLVWVSVDMVCVWNHIAERIVAEVARKIPGFTRDRLIMSAIHVHTAPAVNRREGNLSYSSPFKDPGFDCPLPEGGMTPDEWIDGYYVPLTADAVVRAVKSMEPSGFASVLGHAVIGHNRRVRYRNGSSAMYGDTDTVQFDCIEGNEDNGIEFIYVYDQEDRLKGLVMMMHCPSQAAEQLEGFTADIVGAMRMQLNEKLGQKLPVLSLIGTAGDISPRDMQRFNFYHKKNQKGEPNGYSYELSWELGRRLVNAFEYSRPAAEASIRKELEFAVEFDHVPVQIRTVTEEEGKHGEAVYKEYMEKFGGDIAPALKALEADGHTFTILQYYRWILQNTKPLYYAPVHIVRLGDCAFATNPFEMYLAYGQRMRARCRAEHVFPVQLTNDHMYYLPTAEAEKASGYSATIGQQFVFASGGELLTEYSIEHMNAMFDPEEGNVKMPLDIRDVDHLFHWD